MQVSVWTSKPTLNSWCPAKSSTNLEKDPVTLVRLKSSVRVSPKPPLTEPLPAAVLSVTWATFPPGPGSTEWVSEWRLAWRLANQEVPVTS